MRVNHLNFFDGPSNLIYCEYLHSVVPGDENHIESNCRGCRFWNGSLQGEGIECLYEDTGSDHFIKITNPTEFMEQRLKTLKMKKSTLHVVDLGRAK